jgi:hypothetical protein
MAGDGLGEEEDCSSVDGDATVEALRCDVEQVASAEDADARVVDQTVEAAPAVEGRAEEFVVPFDRRDVAGEFKGLAAEVRNVPAE